MTSVRRLIVLCLTALLLAAPFWGTAARAEEPAPPPGDEQKPAGDGKNAKNGKDGKPPPADAEPECD